MPRQFSRTPLLMKSLTPVCSDVSFHAALPLLNTHPSIVTRYVSINSRITGWNAVKSRVEQLGLSMTDEQVKEV
ncbi:hypothetical protein IL306_009893 [Fusarium sp. DS 682]|nr:hypothetical protein IL306_009893 [Fusarium sp. DS 682]